MFKLGLIVNPFAGIGGSVALKGSDGEAIRQQALALGADKRAPQRATIALEVLREISDQICIYTLAGEMGEQSVLAAGLSQVEIIADPTVPSSAEDTRKAVKILQNLGVDLILFAGGDGTARDVFSVANENQMVLGLPAGVKIHSGVYAVTPEAAGIIVKEMVSGEIMSVLNADVMDIDENAFREGRVKARRYGELTIPAEMQYVQAVKSGGKELEELVLEDIAAEIIEQMDDEYWVIGSGTTCAAVMEQLGLDNTLLGLDLVRDKKLVKSDLTESDLLELLETRALIKVVVTVIGGQGHILGRGNQQLSAKVLSQIAEEDLLVIATKSKLKALNGKPLLVDTGDIILDHNLAGQKKIITGYHDFVSYRIGLN